MPFLVFGSTQVLGGLLLVTVPYIKQRIDTKYDAGEQEGGSTCVESVAQCVEMGSNPGDGMDIQVCLVQEDTDTKTS